MKNDDLRKHTNGSLYYMLVNNAECTLGTGFKSIPEYTFQPVLKNQKTS